MDSDGGCLMVCGAMRGVGGGGGPLGAPNAHPILGHAATQLS